MIGCPILFAHLIAQLTSATDISRQGVTRQLQVLANAGLVRDVKLGRQWETALGRLKDLVERDGPDSPS